MIEPLKNQILVSLSVPVRNAQMHPRIWSLPSSCPLLLIGRVKCTEQTEWMRLIEYLLVKKKKKKKSWEKNKSCSGSVQKVIQACLRSKNHYLWWTWTIQSRSYSEPVIAMQTANIYLHLDQTQVMFRISNNRNYICTLLIMLTLFCIYSSEA